jgi:hypothetical protein
MTFKPQSRISIALALLALVSVQSGAVANEINDELISIIQDVEAGWEHGDGTPFREHFLDFEGARYIESGGQNEGLDDLVVNHVEPEGDVLDGLDLNFTNIETHIEGEFAWALADTEVKAIVKKDGRVIHSRGHQTFLFRLINDQWKVVHTHSSSRPVKSSG